MLRFWQWNSVKIGLSPVTKNLPSHYAMWGRAPSIRHVQRRQQHMTCLWLLEQIQPGLAQQLTYRHKCPWLPQGHVAFSHHNGLCAVGYSPSLPLGIDIQPVDSRLNVVAPRFVHPLDQFLPAMRLQALTSLWTAKEAVKKVIAQLQQVPFFRQIVLQGWQPGPYHQFLFWAQVHHYRTIGVVVEFRPNWFLAVATLADQTPEGPHQWLQPVERSSAMS